MSEPLKGFPEFHSPVWESNAAFLKSTHPRLLDELLSRSEEFRQSTRFEVLDSHTHVTFRDPHGNWKPLHSKRNPFQEAGRFLDLCNILPQQNLLFFGLGLGFPLLELLQRAGRPEWILVVEGDWRSFWAFAQLHPLPGLFSTPGLHFLFSPTPEELFSFLQPMSFSLLSNGLKIVRHQASVSLMEPYYKVLDQKILDLRQWAKVNVNTQVRVSEIFSSNYFANLPKILDSIPWKHFENALRGYPAFLIAAGPSLSRNGHLLKRAKGRALLIAVDTVQRILKEWGIEPDIVVSTDFTENAVKYFDSDSPTHTLLLADPEVFPGIPKNYPGPVSFCDIEGKALSDAFRETLDDFGILPKGLSVSHTAFSAALSLGCSPIAFVGQDLAYTAGRTHAKGATHAVNVSESPEFVKAEGLFEPLSVPKNLKVFLDHYEEMIAECRTPIWNCTEGGANIRGTLRKTLREALISLPEPDVSVSEKLHPLFQVPPLQKEKLLPLKAAFTKRHADLRGLRTLSQKLQSIIQKILPRLSLPRTDSSLSELLGLYQNHAKKLSLFEETLNLLRDNMVEAYVEKSRHRKKKMSEIDWNKDFQEAGEILTSNRFYFERVEQASSVLCEQMQKSGFLEP